MPVYNEEEAITSVLDEWRKQLDSLQINYTFCILNDGSKDTTLSILNKYADHYPQLKIIDKSNSGHGQTCLTGYRIALESKAEWILQLDSDGQCDPQYLPKFIAAASSSKAVYGYRKHREDGFARFLISRFVTLFTLAATGKWIKDANVPYRLISADLMQSSVPKIQDDFFLVNIYLSVLISQQTRIKWVDITFRDRSGGSPSIKTFSFVKHGVTLFKQLRAAQ